MKHELVTFLYGQGLKKDFKEFEVYFNVPEIDWNTWKVKVPKETKVLVGFSMGAILACELSTQKKFQKLVLCSMMPGVETLKNIKADEVIFLVGEKEKWTHKETKRVSKTLSCVKSIIVIPGADHRLAGNYRRKLLEILSK